jgi:hypothetical protein
MIPGDTPYLPPAAEVIRELIEPGSDKQAIIDAHLKRTNQARLHLLKPKHRSQADQHSQRQLHMPTISLGVKSQKLTSVKHLSPPIPERFRWALR